MIVFLKSFKIVREIKIFSLLKNIKVNAPVTGILSQVIGTQVI